MANEYRVDVRRDARRLWLTGRYTDEEIATTLNLPRADTIRDWRNTENWRQEKERERDDALGLGRSRPRENRLTSAVRRHFGDAPSPSSTS